MTCNYAGIPDTGELATLHAHYLRTVVAGRGDVFNAPWWLYQVGLIDEAARREAAKPTPSQKRTNEQRDLLTRYMRA